MVAIHKQYLALVIVVDRGIGNRVALALLPRSLPAGEKKGVSYKAWKWKEVRKVYLTLSSSSVNELLAEAWAENGARKTLVMAGINTVRTERTAVKQQDGQHVERMCKGFQEARLSGTPLIICSSHAEHEKQVRQTLNGLFPIWVSGTSEALALWMLALVVKHLYDMYITPEAEASLIVQAACQLACGSVVQQSPKDAPLAETRACLEIAEHIFRWSPGDIASFLAISAGDPIKTDS